MKRLFTSVCLSLCAAAAFASTAAAQPQPTPGRVEQVVQLGDIDLHTQAGAKVAARRIHIAADYVCGGDNLLWRRDFDFPACRDAAIDRALAALQAPLVSAALDRQVPAGLAAR
jgi:UrcA family protein